MKFVIEIIDVSKETKPTASGKGTYGIMTVTFKNTGTGKIEAKKLVSFGQSASAFQLLEAAVKGNTYEIESVKGEKYWEWVSAARYDGVPPAPTAPATSAATGSTSYKSNYETSEERATRQIMIVRQSSLANAVALLGAGASPAAVLQLAQSFVDFVVNGPVVGPTAVSSNFDDMSDDIPM